MGGWRRLAPETTEDADKADQKCVGKMLCLCLRRGAARRVRNRAWRPYPEAVEMAGGMTADAGTCAVNLAESVYDGLMVYIPDSEEAAGWRAV